MKKYKLRSKIRRPNTPAFLGAPHARGHIMRLRVCTPRKPNSARRPVAKAVLFKKLFITKRKRVTAHIPGGAHNLRRHATILARGGGARDLPGVHYSCVRGVYDLVGVVDKKRRRSIYGVKMPIHLKKKARRKFRL